MDTVLIINADLGPLHRVSLRHAIRMILRQVAEIHEAEPDRIIGVYPTPKIVRLVQYVVTKWRYSNGQAWSRAGVLVRDGRHRSADAPAVRPGDTRLGIAGRALTRPAASAAAGRLSRVV